MIDVGIRYFSAILAVGCVLLMATFVAMAVRARAGIRARVVLLLIGTLLIGAAGLEKLGWSAKPWGLGSPAQGFDDIMFWAFWLVGIGFVFTAWMLWLNPRERSKASEPESQKLTELTPEPVTPIR